MLVTVLHPILVFRARHLLHRAGIVACTHGFRAPTWLWVTLVLCPHLYQEQGGRRFQCTLIALVWRWLQETRLDTTTRAPCECQSLVGQIGRNEDVGMEEAAFNLEGM